MKKNILVLLMLAGATNVMCADGISQTHTNTPNTFSGSWPCKLFFIDKNRFIQVKKDAKDAYENYTNVRDEFKASPNENKLRLVESALKTFNANQKKLKTYRKDSSILGHNVTNVAVGAIAAEVVVGSIKYFAPNWNNYTVGVFAALTFLGAGLLTNNTMKSSHKNVMKGLEKNLASKNN